MAKSKAVENTPWLGTDQIIVAPKPLNKPLKPRRRAASNVPTFSFWARLEISGEDGFRWMRESEPTNAVRGRASNNAPNEAFD